MREVTRLDLEDDQDREWTGLEDEVLVDTAQEVEFTGRPGCKERITSDSKGT